MSERGRTEKKDTTSRVKRGLRSMSARRLIPGLPKLNRARGKPVKNKRSKDVKQKSKQVKRRAPPPPCDSLIKLLADDQQYVLWLGEDFGATETPNLKDILVKIAGFAEDGEEKTAALALINQKPEKDESNFAAARDSLRTLLGHARFNALFAQCLAETYAEFNEDNVSLKLLRALKPTIIVYSGIDRTIEDSLQHDNLSVTSMTALDLFALKSKNSTADEDMKQVLLDANQSKTIILKPQGDITKPDSLLISKPEKFGGYGLAADGAELPEDALDQETKTMMSLLKLFADDMPIVFLGQDLSKQVDPVAHLLKAFKGNDEAVEPKHVALVKNSVKENQRFSDAEVGLVYQSYEPHSSGTQIAEFMSQMVGFRTAIPEENPDIDVPFTVAVADNAGAAQFISSLADKETVAKTINIFATSFDTVPFLLPNDFKELMEKKLNLDREVATDAAAFDAFMEAIDKRTSAFNNKLVPRPTETAEETEEAPAAEDTPAEGTAEETAEEPVQTDEADNTTYPACINLLLPTAAGINAAKAGTEHELELLQKLKNIVTDSKGRLDLRFIQPVGDSLADDFELLYLKNEKADFGDMALYQKSVTEDFVVNFYENNTNASEEKVLLFERLWIQACSQEESLDLFNGYINDVEAAIVEAGKKKPKKKGLFGRQGSKPQVKKASKETVKKPSKAANSEAEGKPKRDNIIKRIVNNVTSRRHSKVTQAALSTSAAKEEVAAEEEAPAVAEEPKEATATETTQEGAVEAPVEEQTKEVEAEGAKEAAAVEEEAAAEEEPKKEEVEEAKDAVAEKKEKKKKNNWKIGFGRSKKKEEAGKSAAAATGEEEAKPAEDEPAEEVATKEVETKEAAAVEEEEAAEEPKKEEVEETKEAAVEKKEKKKKNWKIGFGRSKKKEEAGKSAAAATGEEEAKPAEDEPAAKEEEAAATEPKEVAAVAEGEAAKAEATA